MPENVLTSAELFPPEITDQIFSTVKDESALAQLVPSTPIPYVGKTEWVMSMDGAASVVDEGAAKPAGSAEITPYVIKPFKVVYQMRVTDEFLKMSDEQRIPHMEAFRDGLSKQIKNAFDIVAMHGIDPASDKKLSFWNKSFDGLLAMNYYKVTENTKIDTALREAINGITTKYAINGVIMSPLGAAYMGAITKDGGDARYPQFDFAFPNEFAGAKCVKSNLLEIGYTLKDPDDPDSKTEYARTDLALVGDFNALRWGYAQDVAFDIITTGDPDGQGDLKRYNQVVLRAEAYIGFGILDSTAFALVGEQEALESE